jgi:hypothetical protein
MEHNIKKLDEVWTVDEKKLGLAQKLFHRQDGVNPNLQLYASYLKVENFEYGESFYIPTDYISGRDPVSGHLRLSVTNDQVMNHTWFRMPDFVAHEQYDKELLPEN